MTTVIPLQRQNGKSAQNGKTQYYINCDKGGSVINFLNLKSSCPARAQVEISPKFKISESPTFLSLRNPPLNLDLGTNFENFKKPTSGLSLLSGPICSSKMAKLGPNFH